MEAPAGFLRRQWSKWGARTQSTGHRSEISSPDQECESDGRWGEDSGKGLYRETPTPTLLLFPQSGRHLNLVSAVLRRACSVLCLLMHSVALQGNLEASDSPSRESERTRGREEGHAPQDLSVCRCTSVPRGQRSATWRGSPHEVP